MKYLVRIVFLAVVIGFGVGFYLKNTTEPILGNKIVGFSAVGLILLMFLFIIYRFSKSDRSKYIFSPTEKNEELEDWLTTKNSNSDIK